jgi:tRNA U34 5-methylaminomethyl-2-thiouridine-forming methyltransferase MnmC
MQVELQVTSDGSHTLLNPQVNECYHSTHGALQESLHVFIRSGLDHIANPTRVIRILEVGLGTGLNALLTVQAAHDRKLRIEYTAVETFPLETQITAALNYPALIGNPSAAKWFENIHAATWESAQAITPFFKLKKMKGRLQDLRLEPASFDLVYFDAFAPQKQPEMWLPEVLANVADAMDHGACLVTYCAKGQVKRDLRAAGLEVEALPGPPGKREMIRACKGKVTKATTIKFSGTSR